MFPQYNKMHHRINASTMSFEFLIYLLKLKDLSAV